MKLFNIQHNLFHFVAVMMIAVLCCHSVSQAQAAGVTLIARGQSAYAIVIPDPSPDAAQNRSLNTAANLLQSTLLKATGAKLPIMAEGNFKTGAPAILLGLPLAAQKAGLPVDKITGWTTLKAVRDQNVYLLGYDGKGDVTEHNFHYQGTIRAVASFLEDIGVRFLLPGPHGTYVPHLDRVGVPANLDDLQAPFLTYVIGRSSGDDIYSDANNFLNSDEYKSFGGHSYYSAVPAAEYAQTHPEYFILKGGVRTAAGNHLCISNPAVQQLMIDQMEKYFDAGYQWIELGQTDGYMPCECDQCRAISPDPAERTWIVHRALAERMAKLRPGKKVVILSYGPTQNPPKSFQTFPDNVIIEVTHAGADNFKAWEAFANVPKTVYIYNWGNFHLSGFGGLDPGTPQYVADQAVLFHRNNVRGIYTDGAFERFGLEGPEYYIYGKMLNNPDLNWKELAQEYYNDAFGKAAPSMTDFYNVLYAHVAAVYKAKDTGTINLGTPEDIYTRIYSQDTLNRLTNDLSAAQKLDDDSDVQARLRLVEREFDYVKTTADAFIAYHRYQDQPDWNTFDAVEKTVAARATLIDSFYDENGKKKIFDGFPNPFGSDANKKRNLLVGGVGPGRLDAPFTWNFEELRKNQFLPGKTQLKVRQIDAIHMQPFAITGKLDNPAWQKAPQGQFVESNLQKILNGTRFSVGYDDANLYLAFDCQRDQMNDFHPVSGGKDGVTWRPANQDELELSIGLGNDKQYRFFFNPTQNSTFDGRFGFITDKLDPRYGDWDDGWDGKWSYAFNIDRDGNRWTAELQLPFSTLGIQPPGRGATLQMSLRRLNFLYQPDLLGWTPGEGAPIISTWTGPGYKDYGLVTFK